MMMMTATRARANSLQAKQLRAKPRITIGERRFKRYHVNTDGSEIAPEIQQAAYAFVPNLLPSFDDDTEPAGFIVLHQGAHGVTSTSTAGSGTTSCTSGRQRPASPTSVASR